MRAWESSTITTYAGEVARAVRECPHGTLRDALEARLQSMAHRGYSESGAKNLLAGIRMLEKMGLVPPTVKPGDCLVVRALAKRAALGRKPK